MIVHQAFKGLGFKGLELGLNPRWDDDSDHTMTTWLKLLMRKMVPSFLVLKVRGSCMSRSMHAYLMRSRLWSSCPSYTTKDSCCAERKRKDYAFQCRAKCYTGRARSCRAHCSVVVVSQSSLDHSADFVRYALSIF